MQYIKKDLGSYNLHLIETDKFKTVTIRVIFHSPIQKEKITSRNILTDMLLMSSKNYPTRRDLTIKSEDLYAADITTNNQRLGKYIMTSFILETLNDKYTEKNNLKESIKFLSEIIYQPDIKDNKFSKEKLEQVKATAKSYLNSLKENARSYSLMRLQESYDNESPTSYRMVGYLEDLEKITEESLLKDYQTMIDNDFVDIFVVGQFDSNEMLQIIKDNFKFKKIKKQKESYYVERKKPRKRRLFAKETIENSQSKLAIACPVTKLTEYERNFPLVLANLIYGGGPDAKLFKNVREENSLCYTINSSYQKLDNLVVVTAGIDASNFKKTVDLVTENLNNLKKGHFTENDLKRAKEYYHSILELTEEDPNRLINEYLIESILKLPPLQERIETMNAVNKSEITKVFKKINIDTVFLLEGVKNEEN